MEVGGIHATVRPNGPNLLPAFYLLAFFYHDLIQVGIHRIDHLELATLEEGVAHDHDIPPAHAGVLGIGDDAISDAINRRAEVGIPPSNIVPILSWMVR